MFEKVLNSIQDSGRKLKKIAGIVLIAELVIALVSVVGSLISGIAVGGSAAAIIIGSGLISAALMAVSAWITALAMDALGEAAESKAEVDLLNRKLDAVMSKLEVEPVTLVVAGPEVARTKKSGEFIARKQCRNCGAMNNADRIICTACNKRIDGSYAQYTPVVPKPKDEIKKICPKCGAQNKPGNTQCFACDTPFEE